MCVLSIYFFCLSSNFKRRKRLTVHGMCPVSHGFKNRPMGLTKRFGVMLAFLFQMVCASSCHASSIPSAEEMAVSNDWDKPLNLTRVDSVPLCSPKFRALGDVSRVCWQERHATGVCYRLLLETSWAV